MNESVWEFMKERWAIKKKEIRDMGIDPDKSFEDLTYNEMGILAARLEVTVNELIEP